MSSILLVATLVADPARDALTGARFDNAARAPEGIERWRRRDDGVTADIVFPGPLVPLYARGVRRKDVVERPRPGAAGRERSEFSAGFTAP
jgi:hypothetical protein